MTAIEVKSPAAAPSAATGMVARQRGVKVVAKTKTALRRALLKVPAILLEGDHPEMPQVSGPGIKYALGPTAPPNHFDDEKAELPASYGTRRLFLFPRDPHWMYAHWDLTREQQAEYNKLSADKHLIVRVYEAGEDLPGSVPVGGATLRGAPAKSPGKAAAISEHHVHPESRHWFVHVDQPEMQCTVELGFYQGVRGRRVWKSIAHSKPATLPPVSVSGEKRWRTADIPMDTPLPQLARTVREHVAAQTSQQKTLPLAIGLDVLRKAYEEKWHAEVVGGHPVEVLVRHEFTGEVGVETPESRRPRGANLTALMTGDAARALAPGASSAEAAMFSLPTSPAGAGAEMSVPSSPSSPFGGMPAGEQNFWFNINAELVIYGATEPDAKVSIAGRIVQLRPDGTFSFRFALPDGQFELPVVAVSGNDSDARGVELKFSRATEKRGDVGAHPQDAALKPPLPEYV